MQNPVPNVVFEPSEDVEPLVTQTDNMRKKWYDVHDKAFESINSLVNIRWQTKKVTVQTQQILNATKYSDGYVLVDSPRVVHIRMGRRVNGGGSKVLKILFHELIHSLVMSSKRSPFFKRPGQLEEWIFDELATDLLAQHVAHEVLRTDIFTIVSLKYALREVTRQVMEDREKKDIRDRIINDIDRAVKVYKPSRGRNYYSFRKVLMDI